MRKFRKDIYGDNGNKLCEYVVDADGTQYIETKNTSITIADFISRITNLALMKKTRNKKNK